MKDNNLAVMLKIEFHCCFKPRVQGCLCGSEVEHLPLAQGMILGSWIRVPYQASYREPASPSTYVSASLCVSLMNKLKKL